MGCNYKSSAIIPVTFKLLVVKHLSVKSFGCPIVNKEIPPRKNRGGTLTKPKPMNMEYPYTT